MKSLHKLILHHYSHLKTFLEVSMDMKRLSLLNIDCCFSLRVIPSSIRLLTGLTTLSMGCSFDDKTILQNLLLQGSLHLSYLRVLDLEEMILDDSFPSNLYTTWPSLEEFNLYGNMFTRLPANISQLCNLKQLDLSYCIHLKELPELPSLIQVLKAHGCTSLQNIEDLSNTYKWLFKISLAGCPKILEDGDCQSHIANLLMKSLVQKCDAVNHRLSITVPESKIPNWFSNRRLGNKIELYLPHNQISKVIGLAVCFRLSVNQIMCISINVKPSHSAKSADSIWVGYMPIDILKNLCHGFEHECFIISFEVDAVECGVCVIYKDDIKQTIETGTWIPDYDELGRIDHDSETSEDLQHGRWSFPTFNFNHGKTNGYISVEVHM